MDQFNDTATGPPDAVNYATPNEESAPLVAAFVPDPAETFEQMVARLTGRDLPGPRNPVTTLPYHPDVATARELERLYPERVRIRYGAPATYYLVGKGRLTFSYMEPEPGFAPLAGEAAAAYLDRHKVAARVPGGRECLQLCSFMPALADARALQAQDPARVFIAFKGVNRPWLMRVEDAAVFVFPKAEDDGRGDDLPLNDEEVEL